MDRTRFGSGVLAVATLAMLMTVVPPARATAPAGCSDGSLTDAATSLHGADARVDRLSVVEGVPSALVLTGEVLPGVRHRLLGADGLWCDAVTGFTTIIDRVDIDGVRAARLLASTAAAPYFDGVTIDALEVEGDLITLTTHARTNGVLADWSISTEGGRITRAAWTSREIGVAPVEPQLEGLTALPGASATYVADRGGRLRHVDDPLGTAALSSAPVASSIIEASDGFRIVVSRGAPYVYSTERSGLGAHDIMAVVVEGTRDNYEEFLDWGLSGEWEAGIGNVFLDGGLAAYCMACVMPSSAFNVHISSAMGEYAQLLGYSYPDPEAFIFTVLGHEIFHPPQTSNAEVQPQGGLNLESSYVEGLARFQETLHEYSEVSHQPGSLVYKTDGSWGLNSCNDYLAAPQNTHAMEWGYVDRVYSACYFWMSVYADEGIAGIRRALEASAWVEQELPRDEQMSAFVEAATGTSSADAVERFAVRALTGASLQWGPARGGGPVLDWRDHLLEWAPGPVTSDVRFLAAGGITGGEVARSTTVSLVADQPDFRFLIVTETPVGVVVEPAVDGATVEPAPDGRRWLIAVAGSTPGFVRLTGAGSGGGGETSELTLGYHEVVSGSSAATPLQSATHSSTSAIEDLSFSLAGEADDPLPGTLLLDTAWAYGASWTGFSGPLAAGSYEVTIPVVLEAAGTSTELRHPTDNAMTWAYTYLVVQTGSYWSYSFAELDLSVGTHELRASFDLEEAEEVVIELNLDAEAVVRGGHAQFDLDGWIGQPTVRALS